MEYESWLTEAYRQFFEVPATIIDFKQLSKRERIIKAGLVTSSPDEAEKARSLHQHFRDNLQFSTATTPAYPDVEFINILAPEVSKGEALKTLASNLGISLHEVMAVGDGTNDISLLSSAGFAVAMGNAPANVKAIADHVTLDVEHNGIAAAIQQFLL